MKKLFGLIVVLGLMLSSCNGFDSAKCRAEVESTFPKDQVYSIPGSNFSFLIVDSVGTIKVARSMGIFSTGITSINVIKKGK